MSLSLEQKTLLLANLVRSSTVISKATPLLEPSDFSQDFERPMALIWDISRDFYARTRLPITREYLIAGITSRLENSEGLPDTDIQLLSNLIDFIFERVPETDLFPDIAISMLQDFLNERKLQPFIGSTQSNDLPSLVQQAHREFVRTRVTSASGLDLMDVDNPELANSVSSPRIPTSCGPIDALMGGGITRQEFMGILGPTGGGKTMLGIQLAVSMAQTGRHVCYFSYEGSVKRDLKDRAWACGVGAPISRFQGKRFPRPGESSPEDLDPELVNRLRQLGPMVNHLHAYDMNESTTGFGGVSEIESLIQGEIALGRPPSLIVLDWLSCMAGRYLPTVAKSMGRKELSITDVIKQVIAQLDALRKTYDCAVVVLQQLNGEAGNRGAGSKKTAYEAMDCKTMHYLMDSCLVIDSVLNKSDGLTKLIQSKGRNDGVQELWVALDKRVSRFVTQHSEYSRVRDASGVDRFVTADVIRNI